MTFRHHARQRSVFPGPEVQMNESTTSPTGAARIDAEHARYRVDAYVDAWNEPATDARGQLLAGAMTPDGAYVDPTKKMDSPAAIAEYIGRALAEFPGRRIVRTSAVDAHNSVCRFNWQLVRPDGTRAPESVDFVEFAADGRIRRVTGFFGPLEPRATDA